MAMRRQLCRALLPLRSPLCLLGGRLHFCDFGIMLTLPLALMALFRDTFCPGQRFHFGKVLTPLFFLFCRQSNSVLSLSQFLGGNLVMMSIGAGKTGYGCCDHYPGEYDW